MRNVIAAFILFTAVLFASANANAVEEVGGYEIGTATLTHVETGETQKVIILNGDFGLNITENLAKVLQENPDYRKLIMNSNGGIAHEGWAMSTLLSTESVAVWVPAGRVCLSACANAFMGGRDYEISGQLGFHNSWISNGNWVEIVQQGPDALNNVHAAAQHYGAYTTYHFLANGFSIDLVFDVIGNSNTENFVIFDNEADFLEYYVRDDEVSENNHLYKYMDFEADPVVRHGLQINQKQYEQYQELVQGGGNWEASDVVVHVSTFPVAAEGETNETQ